MRLLFTFAVVLLAGCSSGKRALVQVDVRLGEALAIDTVEIGAQRAAGGQIVQTFDWSRATGGVLQVGLYVPSEWKGNVIVRAQAYSGGLTVAASESATVEVTPGKVAGPVVLHLTKVIGTDAAVASDAAAPDAASDLAVAPDLATVPDSGVAPDQGPDGPPEPPSLAKCTEYAHAPSCNPNDPSMFDSYGVQVPGIRFSLDGRFLVTAGTDGRAVVWKVTATGLEPDGRAFTGKGSLRVEFSPGGSLMALAGLDEPNIVLYDFATAVPAGTLVGQAGRVRAIAFSADGNTLVSADDAKLLKVWDVAGRTEIKRLTLPGEGVHLAVNPKGPAGTLWVAAGFSDLQDLYQVDVRAVMPLPARITAAKMGYTVTAVTYSPDGTTLAAGANDLIMPPVVLWDVRNIANRQVVALGPPLFVDPRSTPLELAYSPDGRYLAAAYGNAVAARQSGSVKIAPVAYMGTTPPPLRSSTSPTWSPGSIAYSPDGRAVAVGSLLCGKFLYCRD